MCASALDFYWPYIVSRWSLMTFDTCVTDSCAWDKNMKHRRECCRTLVFYISGAKNEPSYILLRANHGRWDNGKAEMHQLTQILSYLTESLFKNCFANMTDWNRVGTEKVVELSCLFFSLFNSVSPCFNPFCPLSDRDSEGTKKNIQPAVC